MGGRGVIKKHVESPRHPTLCISSERKVHFAVKTKHKLRVRSSYWSVRDGEELTPATSVSI